MCKMLIFRGVKVQDPTQMSSQGANSPHQCIQCNFPSHLAVWVATFDWNYCVFRTYSPPKHGWNMEMQLMGWGRVVMATFLEVAHMGYVLVGFSRASEFPHTLFFFHMSYGRNYLFVENAITQCGGVPYRFCRFLIWIMGYRFWEVSYWL